MSCSATAFAPHLTSPIPGECSHGKALVATLQGIGRQEALVDIPFREFSYLQARQSRIVGPEVSSASLAVAQPLTLKYRGFESEGSLKVR